MIERFLEKVKVQPEHIAIIVNDMAHSYLELFECAKKIAKALAKNEAQLIGVFVDNTFETYTSIIGVLMAGKGFVPLNSKFPDSRLINTIEQTELGTILYATQSNERIKNYERYQLINVSEIDAVTDYECQKLQPESIAYILFTSGSTGEPKGISITNENFESLLKSLISRYPLSKENKVLQCFELSFDVSIACTFLALSSGSTLVVSSVNGIVAVNAFKAIYDYQIDFVVIAPSAITYLVNYKLIPQFEIPFVKVTLFTGEALPYKEVELWQKSAKNTIIDNAYGPTEVTVWSYFYRIDDQTKGQLINGLCPIGNVFGELKYRIIQPENSQEAQKGELQLSGKQVFNAYWKNSEKTKSVLINEGNTVWYSTGDLVFENEHDNIVYINRLDNQVKVNGYRIELGEIEHVIKTETESNVVVVVAKNKQGNNQLIAFLDKKTDFEMVKQAVSTKLTFYMIPKAFYFIKAFPLNVNGKVDRNKLKEIANEN